MPTPQQFSFDALDQQKIHAYKWPASTTPSACVQIAHGMAEYALRYSDFAGFLNDHGIAVYANDHRGHGKTAGKPENAGYFAARDGWALCVEDMLQLNGIIHKENPGVPVFLLGHSMGSFLSRTYLVNHSDTISGCVLSGTGSQGSLLIGVGMTLAKVQRFFMGDRHRNELVNKMSFGSFNKKIAHPETDFDWLTRDRKIVADYIADEYCGFVCTTGFFIDLFTGLKIINNIQNIQLVRKDLPVFFVAGQEDPVGNYGKGVNQTVEKFTRAGIKDISEKIYPDDRHEILNELDKEAVWTDVLQWIQKHI